MRLSRTVIRAALASSLAAALAVGVGTIPAQAAEKGECTIKVKAVNGDSIGGNSSSWTCNKATKVTVALEAGVYIAGHYYSKTKNLSYSSLNGTASYQLPIVIDGASELVVFGTVCYQWTSSVRKCRERSDSISFLG